MVTTILFPATIDPIWVNFKPSRSDTRNPIEEPKTVFPNWLPAVKVPGLFSAVPFFKTSTSKSWPVGAVCAKRPIAFTVIFSCGTNPYTFFPV